MIKSDTPVQQKRPTPTIEDYLAVIYVLERDGGEVIAARLADALEVSAPTVTVTVKRMERDGWIGAEPGKAIRLTPKGLEAARSVIRRHMLTEWMLARMLKVPWSRVHAEADQIEHTISDQIETQLRSNLDDPQVCPHGNPLPGYEYVAEGWIALTEVPGGTRVTIRRIHEIIEDDPDLLEYLETNGIVPGARAEVTEILPFNQTLTVKVGEHPVALGLAVARYIFVEPAT
ncbi:iron (metal) dependent repressor, DtxR family [Longilinea arvoryzae]|uniref:Iron (Metal) dependent repressor, DtxR family n=1 Tax=Longilinea arvoryzae TaxID=360412 RepID=A0A0K8MXR0_9CHLR|nr:metal-dependent transcriptional regulator [Longilinea arvoryzae]GAP16039.1 iron (metal) dependent repressor, DtxR family [Longilinea arvoryzae]